MPESPYMGRKHQRHVPRLPRRLSWGVLTLATILTVVVVGFAALIVKIGLGGIATDDQHWEAIGVLTGIAGLILAAVGTGLAGGAWVAANEKPRLTVEAFFVGKDPNYSAWTRDLRGNSDELPMEIRNWHFQAVLKNEGRVAARFVALRLTFEGQCLFSFRGKVGNDWRTIPEAGAGRCAIVEWSGGANVVVHANGFTYPVPMLDGVLHVRPSANPSIRVDVVTDDFSDTISFPIVSPPTSNIDPT